MSRSRCLLAVAAFAILTLRPDPAPCQAPVAPLPPAPPWDGASRQLVRPASDPWITPAEASGFTTTPSYDETVAWLRRLEAAATLPGARLRLLPLGRTAEGRQLWLVVASAEGAATPAELRTNGKPTVLAQAGIHAGEIDGKDAGLMLLRDIALGGKSELLARVNFLFVPVLNADGHELRTALSRINQRGPENAGWRTTGKNLNLNRDYAKLDAPETRAVVAALRAWEPDLYLDLHVTDGGDYQYDITFGGAARPAWSPAIAGWLEDSFRPAVGAALSAAGHVPGPLWVAYLADDHDPLKGYVEFADQARFSSGYGDARHLPAVLVENHSLKPYDQRVLGTYVLLEATLRHVGAAAAELRQAILADRSRRDETVVLERKLGEETREVEVLGIDWRTSPSAVTGGSWMEWTGQPRTIRAPLRLGNAVVASATRPRAYWVPPAWGDVIERLAWHGVTMEPPLAAPRELDVEACRLTGVKLAELPFEGRVALVGASEEPWSSAAAATGTGCALERRRERLPAGSVRVPTDQPLGVLAMILLEPASPDSFLRWGFFHEILQRTEYVEGYVMEPLAKRMLAADPALRAEYDRAVAADPALAKDPQARLAWLYRRSPWADDRYLLYPVSVER